MPAMGHVFLYKQHDPTHDSDDGGDDDDRELDRKRLKMGTTGSLANLLRKTKET
jgi:hypothetical protein